MECLTCLSEGWAFSPPSAVWFGRRLFEPIWVRSAVSLAHETSHEKVPVAVRHLAFAAMLATPRFLLRDSALFIFEDAFCVNIFSQGICCSWVAFRWSKLYNIADAQQIAEHQSRAKVLLTLVVVGGCILLALQFRRLAGQQNTSWQKRKIPGVFATFPPCCMCVACASPGMLAMLLLLPFLLLLVLLLPLRNALTVASTIPGSKSTIATPPAPPNSMLKCMIIMVVKNPVEWGRLLVWGNVALGGGPLRFPQ